MYENLRQKDINVLEVLKKYSREKGYAPSVREICSILDIKSTSTVFSIINKLDKYGYIKKDPSRPRALVIVDNENESNTIGINASTVSLPLIGSITAGQPILAEQNIEEYIPLPESYIKGRVCFLLKVNGDSMIDAGILDRDYIIVDSTQTTPTQGQMVAALIEEESATVKTFYKKDGKIVLKPENQSYEPMIFDPNEVRILGVVTGLFRTI